MVLWMIRIQKIAAHPIFSVFIETVYFVAMETRCISACIDFYFDVVQLQGFKIRNIFSADNNSLVTHCLRYIISKNIWPIIR